MKLYFVRHGETTDASQKISQTQSSSLSTQGRKQAKLLASRLVDVKIDVIYSSPMTRAQETTEIINKKLKLPVEFMDNVKELKRATALEGLSRDSEIHKKVRELALENRHNPDWKYEDSESVREIWDRSGKAIDHLIKEHLNDTVLVVSHGNFIRAFLARVLFGDEINIGVYHMFRKKFYSFNTSISLLEYTPEKGWMLVFWNDVAHIESFEKGDSE